MLFSTQSPAGSLELWIEKADFFRSHHRRLRQPLTSSEFGARTGHCRLFKVNLWKTETQIFFPTFIIES